MTTITITPFAARHLLRLIGVETELIGKVPGNDPELDQLQEELTELADELEAVADGEEIGIAVVDEDVDPFEDDDDEDDTPDPSQDLR
jgi:hypothetical protein